MTKIPFYNGSIVVEHSPCHLKSEGLNLTLRTLMPKKIFDSARGGSKVVEHSPCHLKAEGLNLTLRM
jgi:hypothetical protein